MPTTIRELGIDNITDAQIDAMVAKCTWGGSKTVGQFVKLSVDDVRKIYHMSK